MIRRPPRSTRTDTLFPYTTLGRASAAFTNPPISRSAGPIRARSPPDLAFFDPLAQSTDWQEQNGPAKRISDFIRRWSPNFYDRRLPISIIILHYNGDQTSLGEDKIVQHRLATASVRTL